MGKWSKGHRPRVGHSSRTRASMTSMVGAQACSRKRAAAPGCTPGLLTFNQDTFDLLARVLCARPSDLPSLASLARTAKPLAALVAASAVWEGLYRAVAASNAGGYLRECPFDHVTVMTFNGEQGLHPAFSHAAMGPRMDSPTRWREACEMLLGMACKGCGAMSAQGKT